MPYGSNSYYQQPYMNNGYSYYIPGMQAGQQQYGQQQYGQQQWGSSSYYPQQAVAGGSCCGAAVQPVGYSAPMSGGCCGASSAYPMYSQPIAYGGGDCGCEGGRHHRRGLFRR